MTQREPAATLQPRTPVRTAARIAALGLTILIAGFAGAPMATSQSAPDRVDERALREAARRLDAAVDQDLRAHGLTPNPTVDDPTFLRRASLRIIGRIPTLAETREHLGTDLQRRLDRDALVDQLFASPGHVSRMLNYWSDLFRARDELARRVSGEPFLHRIGQFVAADEPYDEFVRDLLTASGAAHARGNGATGYLLRDRGMPHDNMANTARLFLGSRIECAQCHDHPFEDFSQREFFELAAFQGGLQYVDTSLFTSPEGRKLVEAGRQARQAGNEARRAFARLLQGVTVGISGTGTSAETLPEDYAYDDARPGDMVTAMVPFGPEADVDDPVRRSRRELRVRRRQPAAQRIGEFAETGSREAFADWLTAPENPRFAKVVGARMWKLMLGIGPIEPVDDLREDTVAANPALFATLEELVLQFDYDLRAVLRAIARTRAFGREAVAFDPADAEPFRFQGPALERMTAEQIWDSLLTLAIDDPDASLAPPEARAEGVYSNYESFVNQSEAQLSERVETMTLRYTDPDAYRQRLAKLRRERLAASRADRDADRAELRKAAAPLLAELQKARRARDQAKVAEVMQRIRDLREQIGSRARGGGSGRGLARASELEMPAPPAHLLREFGQSAKETIDGSFDDANVPQALRLMNGVVDEELLRPGSAISRHLHAVTPERDPQAAVELAYLAILQRRPTAAEGRAWARDIHDDGTEAVHDLVWTLVNSHEFRFVD